MPVLISTIDNFLDIYGIGTKSGEFSPYLLENENYGNILSQGIHLLPRQHSIRRHASSHFAFLVFFSKY